MNKGNNRYLLAAIVWTVIALIVCYVLLFMTTGGGIIGKLCGMLLIALCIVGQWLRYIKSR